MLQHWLWPRLPRRHSERSLSPNSGGHMYYPLHDG
ncbi:hypothetical protein A6R68_23214 [Neotoma lepida]|uniref:Uncharacterized protein n=1 Tax=Neotoma lepida TaxID=56216 RepID=A0A1A6HX39_NEOLE|nr:hypothetical protein A6R68_23214 [Neotoma lepida]